MAMPSNRDQPSATNTYRDSTVNCEATGDVGAASRHRDLGVGGETPRVDGRASSIHLQAALMNCCQATGVHLEQVRCSRRQQHGVGGQCVGVHLDEDGVLVV